MDRLRHPAVVPSTDTDVDRRSTRSRIASAWLLPLASTLLSIVLLTGLIGGVALLVGSRITGIEVVLAVAATGVGLAFWLSRIHGRRWPLPWVLIIAAAASVILPNLILGGRVLDDTWDGQWYHQEAVIQLAGGWNPFHADLSSAEVPHDGARIRINGYPKATWLWGASLYQLTHRIERAKAFSLPLLAAAGLVVLACLLIVTSIRPAAAVVIALVAAANPVAVTQFLNAFQDGALASLLTVLVASLAFWLRAGSRVGLALATASAVGAASIKLTGPVYVVIIVTAAMAWLWWSGRWRDQRRALGFALVLAAAGTLILSGGAYATNTARHGHPFYPVLGPDRVDIVETVPHNRFQGLAASLFLRSQLTSDDYESVAVLRNWRGLKVPFTVDRDELEAFFYPYVRIGGWGPLFGGVVLLTIGLVAAVSIRRPRRAAVIIVASGPLLLSVLVNPYCWKLRYAPQSWLVPLVIVAMTLAARPTRLEKTLSGALLAAAGVNALLVGWAHVPAVIDHSGTLKERLLDLGRRRQTLELSLQPFRSNRVRLAELGIAFTEVDDRRASLPVYLGTSPLEIIRLDAEPAPAGGGLARVAWRPTPAVDGYLVEAIVAAPAGPGGSVLTVVRRRTDVPEIEIPIPAGPVTIAVSNCNAIGCGVADFHGPVAAGGAERRRPVLGSPYDGEIVRRPRVVFSWLPAIGAQGPKASYRFRLSDGSTGLTVLEQETENLWIEHRFAEDGSWSARVSAVGSGSDEASEVRFRTEGVASPRLTRPESGTTRTPGRVELVWEAVPGVATYEYFVAVTGRSTALVREVTPATHAAVQLEALDGRPTDYSVIVRACLAAEGCRTGSEIGWGPWSHEAGHGDVKLKVVP